MKKLLNTLYVTTPEAYISKDGTNIVVSVKENEIFRIPIQNIQNIFTFGYQGASPGAMRLCADNSVGLSFFSPNGKFVARVVGPTTGNILLRSKQYSWLTDEKYKLHLSSVIVAAKIYNSRAIIQRFIRDYSSHPGCDVLRNISNHLKTAVTHAQNATTVDALRGIEGDAAATYFKGVPILNLNSDPIFNFSGRQRRPPRDIFNAMLSFGYSLLASECTSALEGVGLDPAMGFMHTLRPGRNALALDLMEELRAYIVDRLVLSMINNRQVSARDFLKHDDGDEMSVIFSDDGRKKFLTAWQSKKKTEIIHPFLKEKIQIGLLPHVQALLLARHLRGDLNDYPAFILK